MEVVVVLAVVVVFELVGVFELWVVPLVVSHREGKSDTKWR